MLYAMPFRVRRCLQREAEMRAVAWRIGARKARTAPRACLIACARRAGAAAWRMVRGRYAGAACC